MFNFLKLDQIKKYKSLVSESGLKKSYFGSTNSRCVQGQRRSVGGGLGTCRPSKNQLRGGGNIPPGGDNIPPPLGKYHATPLFRMVHWVLRGSPSWTGWDGSQPRQFFFFLNIYIFHIHISFFLYIQFLFIQIIL